VTSRKRKAGVPPAFSLTHLGEPIQIMPVERHAVKDFLLALGTILQNAPDRKHEA
jgi:hypothetical protein